MQKKPLLLATDPRAEVSAQAGSSLGTGVSDQFCIPLVMMVCMDIADISHTLWLASLPDGSLIRVEVVHSDGYLSAGRVEGECAGMLVVCEISKTSV